MKFVLDNLHYRANLLINDFVGEYSSYLQAITGSGVETGGSGVSSTKS